VRDYPCDICGADDPLELAVARKYTNDQPLHVCRNCGFLYVRTRRGFQAIAAAWSDDLFQSHYTARRPYMKARHVFVVDTIADQVGLGNKTLCDVGAGEGQLLELLRSPEYGANVFGIEPSKANGRLLANAGIPHFVGTIEDYVASGNEAQFDLVTITWALENCESGRRMLDSAWSILKPGGHVVVATGSRILVPFKKPLHYYLGPSPADTNSFRYSANTLRGALAVSHFETVFSNRYIDHDVLMMIGRKVGQNTEVPWDKDDPAAVIDYFDRWDADTQRYFKDV
jgi:SAM-dependent methyltransferase